MPIVDEIWDQEWLFHSTTTIDSNDDEFNTDVSPSTFPDASSAFDLSAMAVTLPFDDNVVSHGGTILPDIGAAMDFNPLEFLSAFTSASLTLTADENMIVELHDNPDDRSHLQGTTSATEKSPVRGRIQGVETISLTELQLSDEGEIANHLNNQFNPSLLSKEISETTPCTSELLDPGQHVFQAFKPKRTRHNKKKVEIGNNECGKLGKLRCEPCRRRKSKCIFTSIDVPCEFCQGRGIGSSCIKKWGQKKEESMAIIKEAAAAIKEKCITVSRRIPTAIDETIRHEDVLLLQFAYSDSFIYGGNCIIGHFLRRMACSFTPSINSQPLRHAALAFAAAFVPPSSISYFERLQYHKAAAYTALRKKLSSEVDESDLFAVCLLAVISTLYQDYRGFSIHLDGFILIMKELSHKAAAEGGSSPLRIYWPLVRDLFESDLCRPANPNERAIEFIYLSQQTIGPQSFSERMRYFTDIFGVPSERLRLYTYSESIWQHVLLLRRCFRSTVYRQMQGHSKTSSVVASVVSEVSRDLQCQEVTRILGDIFPRDSDEGTRLEMDPAWGISFKYTILLHYFCELLIVHLNADQIVPGASSLEAIRAASLMVRFLETEWVALGQDISFPASFPFVWRDQRSRLMISRMLWIAGLSLTRRNDLDVSEWLISRLEELGEPRMAKLLESFWDHEDMEYVARCLDMPCDSAWPLFYRFW